MVRSRIQLSFVDFQGMLICGARSRPIDFELSTAYMKSSLHVDSTEMRRICQSAADHHIAVVLGFSENFKGSLYISQAIINAEGSIEVLRRKLKATHMERTIFGDASGSALQNVVELPDIGRVGALACWEHTQPLLKYHTYHQRETIHVAAWPPLYDHDGGPGLYSMSKEGVLSYCIRAESPLANVVGKQVAAASPKSTPWSRNPLFCILQR